MSVKDNLINVMELLLQERIIVLIKQNSLIINVIQQIPGLKKIQKEHFRVLQIKRTFLPLNVQNILQ